MTNFFQLFLLLSLSTVSLFGQNPSVEVPDLSDDRVLALPVEGPLSGTALDKLDQAVAEKRFVSIGEFTHGSREVFLLRNRLIEYLHEQHGFDVILFEAGIGELIVLNEEKHNLTDRQLTGGFFGPWRTEEFRDLMRYVRENEIEIAGFDVQRTARSFDPLLRELFISADLDTTTISLLEPRFGRMRRDLPSRKVPFSDFLDAAVQELILQYEQAHQSLLHAKSTYPVRQIMMALKTIENRIAYLRYMIRFKQGQDWNQRWADRDSLMASNVEWLTENIYRNRKIIIVGHNFHLARHNSNEAVMGAFLEKVYPGEIYIIGTFAGGGTYVDNYGREVEMAEPAEDTLDLKHIIRSLQGEINFIELGSGSSESEHWSRQAITVKDTFIDLYGSEELQLAKGFDAVLLISESSIPIK